MPEDRAVDLRLEISSRNERIAKYKMEIERNEERINYYMGRIVELTALIQELTQYQRRYNS